MEIKSKFKIKSLLSMLFLFVISFFPLYFIFPVLFRSVVVKGDFSFPFWFLVFMSSFFICMQTLLYGLMRKILITEEFIMFINPVFPFLRKKIYWDEIDFTVYVYEGTLPNIYETIYLIKNRKLWYKISSYSYSNYEEIKLNLKVKNEGQLDISFVEQVLLKLGKKIPA